MFRQRQFAESSHCGGACIGVGFEPLVHRFRLVKVAMLKISLSQREKRRRVAGLDLERRLECGDGLGKTTRVVIEMAEKIGPSFVAWSE